LNSKTRELGSVRQLAALSVVFAVLSGVVVLPLTHSSFNGQTRPGTGRTVDLQGLGTPPPSTSWYLPDYPLIEDMRNSIVNTFQQNETSIEGTGGLVYGMMPAPEYGMIYIRDISTMMPALSWFYGEQYLRTPVEEFLRRQYGPDTSSADGHLPGDGAISAVLAPSGHIDKATAVSDEETHLINAAYEYYHTIGGRDWLQEQVGGETVLSRLNRALDWLYTHRFDPTFQLIKRGHTTDWGDVKFEPSDEPTDIDPLADHWTCSVYDQALTYRALLQLAEMNEAVGAEVRARSLRERAEHLHAAANERLWSEESEAYLLHLHITPLTHPFPEDEMVSISNALAVYTGLSTPQRARQALGSVEDARLAAGASKPGLSIYPPYPPGFFAHPQMAAGEYQNGGLWDWWGGVQITAEFKTGKSARALAHLRMVAREWDQHPGQIFEWQSASTGEGWGSSNYASAAATMGEAILRGLFGVTMGTDGITLRSRLGKHDGQVRAVQPATGLYLSYDYTYNEPGLVVLDYGSNHPRPLEIALLLPPGREIRRVSLDGHEIPYRVETLLEDRFCAFSADSGVHRAILSVTTLPMLDAHRTASGSSSCNPPP
jgi:hypothetical protein